jgi:hypothetical protein
MPTLQQLENRPSNGPISREMFTYRFPLWLWLTVLLLSAHSLVARVATVRNVTRDSAPCRIRYGDKTADFTLKAGAAASLDGGLNR